MATEVTIEGQVATLGLRSKTWWARGRKLAISAGAATGLALAALVAGSLLGPDNSLGNSLDIPAQVADVIDGTGVYSPINQEVISAAGAMAGNLMPVVLGLALLVFVITGLRYLFSFGDGEQSLALFAVPFAMVFGAVMVMNIFGLEEDGSSRAPGEIVSIVEASSQAATPAGLYVLAQVSLKENENDDKKLLQAAAKSMRGQNLGFVPDPRVLYLIEIAAYGKAQSTAAVAYYLPRVERRNTAAGVSRGFFFIALAQGAVAFAFCWLGWSIGRRTQRVKHLLSASEFGT